MSQCLFVSILVRGVQCCFGPHLFSLWTTTLYYAVGQFDQFGVLSCGIYWLLYDVLSWHLAKSSHLRSWTRLQTVDYVVDYRSFFSAYFFVKGSCKLKKEETNHTHVWCIFYSFSATLWGYLHLCIWQMLIQRNYNSIKVYIYIRSVHWDSYCFNLMKTEVHASSV